MEIPAHLIQRYNLFVVIWLQKAGLFSNSASSSTKAAALTVAELVDYAELPLNFDHYSEAAHSGADLEVGQFPVTELSIDEALAQIAKLKKA